MKKFFVAATAAMIMVGCSTPSEPVVTFAEAEDPVALSEEAAAKWGEVKKTLNGAWGCADCGCTSWPVGVLFHRTKQ